MQVQTTPLMCSTAWQVPLVLSNPKLIVSFDPGVPCTFLLFRVDSVSPTVIMCGTADVRNEDAPLRSLGGEQAPSSFETLRQMLDLCDLIVWEKQRGWLHEHGYKWTQNIHGMEGITHWLKVVEDGEDPDALAAVVRAKWEEVGFEVEVLEADAAEWAG